MKYERNRHSKFHIKKEDADRIWEEVLLSKEQKVVLPEQIPEEVINLSASVTRDPYLLFICLGFAMFFITLLFPFFVFIKGSDELAKVDEARLEAAELMADENSYDTSVLIKGSRDNYPECLVPVSKGTSVFSNSSAYMDASNMSDGYIIVKYLGDCPKVKLRITGPDDVTYTYNITPDSKDGEVFPLQAGDGHYLIGVFENISGTQYATAFSEEIDLKLRDPYLPFLYPNQYVNFSEQNQAIEYAEYLAYSANSDLDVVTNVYNALISSMTYDYEEAETVESGYIPDVDEVLTTGKGICLDYAVLMTAMLRSQRIPTRMEVGYAGTAYHAWISTYIKDIGWVNGMIRFDGKDWSLMDPTFASTTDTEKLASFIGDGQNYKTKYIY